MGLTEPALVIVDQEFAGKIARLGKKLQGKNVGPLYSYHSLKHHNPIVRRSISPIDLSGVDVQLIRDVENGVGLESLGPQDDGMMYFTSGTSGLPKAVLSSQRAGLHSVMCGGFCE